MLSIYNPAEEIDDNSWEDARRDRLERARKARENHAELIKLASYFMPDCRDLVSFADDYTSLAAQWVTDEVLTIESTDVRYYVALGLLLQEMMIAGFVKTAA